MQRTCVHCQTAMTDDLVITVSSFWYDVIVKQENDGLFNNIKVTPKAAICTNCGYLGLYVEQYDKLKSRKYL